MGSHDGQGEEDKDTQKEPQISPPQFQPETSDLLIVSKSVLYLPAVFSRRGDTKGLQLPLSHQMWFLGQLWKENSKDRFLAPVEEDGEKGGNQDILRPLADIGCFRYDTRANRSRY